MSPEVLLAIALGAPLAAALLLAPVRGEASRWPAPAGSGASALAALLLWVVSGATATPFRATPRREPAFAADALDGILQLPALPWFGEPLAFGLDVQSAPLFVAIALGCLAALAVIDDHASESPRRLRAFGLLGQSAALGTVASLHPVLFWALLVLTLLLALLPSLSAPGTGRPPGLAWPAIAMAGLGLMAFAIALTMLESKEAGWLEWLAAARRHDTNLAIGETRVNFGALTCAIFAAGAALLAGVFPFHRGTVRAATASPTASTILAALVLPKLALWSLMHWALPIFPRAGREVAEWLLVAGLLSALWCGFGALFSASARQALGRLPAAHNGISLAAIAALAGAAPSAAAIYLPAHLLVGTGMLLAFADGGRPGAARLRPALLVLHAPLPGTALFVASALAIGGFFAHSTLTGLAGTLAIAVAGGAAFRILRRSRTAETDGEAAIPRALIAAVAIVLTLAFVWGVYPPSIIEDLARASADWALWVERR